MFGFRMNAAALFVGFATGMVFTRRTGPLAGAGVLALVLPLMSPPCSPQRVARGSTAPAEREKTGSWRLSKRLQILRRRGLLCQPDLRVTKPARSCPAGLLEMGSRQRPGGLRIAACGSPFSLRFRAASGKRACERSGTAALASYRKPPDAQRLFVRLEHPRRASH